MQGIDIYIGTKIGMYYASCRIRTKITDAVYFCIVEILIIMKWGFI